MSLEQKIQLGMVGLTGASLVFAALGVHISPLGIGGGNGSG
jgi:hypothetical protein